MHLFRYRLIGFRANLMVALAASLIAATGSVPFSAAQDPSVP